jgi:hypothetical protein
MRTGEIETINMLNFTHDNRMLEGMPEYEATQRPVEA